MDYKREYLNTSLEKINISLDKNQIELFIKYYDMLIEWNNKFNLTAITEFEDVVIKHFTDSLSITNYLDENKINKILDVGSGAGFPGIPLKIFYPQKEFVLMDSLNKRVNFLNTVADELGLKNIRAVHARAEEMAADSEHRENYDLCVSRAVARLSTLSEYCIPFVKKEGLFISYKSGNSDEEINEGSSAIKILGGKVKGIEEFQLPNSDFGRTLVIIQKVKNTPKMYPRKAGLPKKDPL